MTWFFTSGESAAFWTLILAASSPSDLPAWSGCSPPLMFVERMAACKSRTLEYASVRVSHPTLNPGPE